MRSSRGRDRHGNRYRVRLGWSLISDISKSSTTPTRRRSGRSRPPLRSVLSSRLLDLLELGEDQILVSSRILSAVVGVSTGLLRRTMHPGVGVLNL
eukprot:SAG11_NODE_349_length_10401_cov_22.873423_5_plen_96_part_00